MKRIKIPADLKKMNSLFKKEGYEAYLVGGAVRDMILGKPAADWDIATNATPEQVSTIFRRVIPTGIAHGTVTVHFFGHEIEVTTYRTESSYSDGRHPDAVAYAANIQDDLSRRDFTMNAIAASLDTGELVDPFGGQQDIKAGIIRTVGDPIERFTEDGLRPIRALRFTSQLGFVIQKDTYSAILDPRVKEKTSEISIERFRDEFIRILQSAKPSGSLKLMEQTGVLYMFIPEFKACRGCEQRDYRKFHEFDVMDHLLYACDGAPSENLVVRLAALFHDIGKPSAKRTIDSLLGAEYTFYNHDCIGATITRNILVRLRFSNVIVNAVTHLVQHHMFHYEQTWSDAAVRRFLVRIHPENFDDLVLLRIADIYGMHNTEVRMHDSQTCRDLCELKDRIKKIESEKNIFSLKDLAVTGNDLIACGIPPGKRLGIILKELFNTVLDDPLQNTKPTLLKISQALYKKMTTE